MGYPLSSSRGNILWWLHPLPIPSQVATTRRAGNSYLTGFSDEIACLDYLERLRWPTGFACPRCGKWTNRTERIALG